MRRRIAALVISAVAGLSAVMLYLTVGTRLTTFWTLTSLICAALALFSWRPWSSRNDWATGILELDKRSDELAWAVRDQYQAELMAHAVNDPYPMPVTWHPVTPEPDAPQGRVGRFLRRREDKRTSQSGSVRDLVDLFGAVPSRRLVILGEPGAGKTTLATNFVLSSLNNRTPGQPVPVIFRLSMWNPAEVPFHEWLISQLIEAYPALARTQLAAEMIATQRILPVLDGLDEMAPGSAVMAVEQLNKLMTPFVLTSRPDEYAASAERLAIAAAAVVMLEPLSLTAAIDYLMRSLRNVDSIEAWRQVFDVLRDRGSSTDPRTEALRRCLRSPYFLYLIRMLYVNTGRNPHQLLSLNSDELPQHLLEAVVPAMFERRLGKMEGDEYRARNAEIWLQFIATHMHQMARHEFRWWDLATAVPRWQLAALASLVVGMVSAVSLSVLLGAATGITIAGFSTVTTFLVGPNLLAVDIDPLTTAEAPRPAPATAVLAVLVGCVPLAYGAAFVVGPGTGLIVGSLLLAALSGLWLVSRLSSRSPAVTPERDIGRQRAQAIMEWVTLSAAMLVVAVLAAWGFGMRRWASTAAIEALSVCLLWLILGTTWGRYLDARVWLALRGRLPWRLSAFLTAAWRLGLMRRVGPTYQFTHISLQEWLARRPGVAAPTWEQVSRD